jgi:hypothetical protein
LALLLGHLTGAERIAAHAIRPQRAPDSGAFANLGNLVAAAVETLGTDHSKDRHGGMADLPKILSIYQARIAADGLPLLGQLQAEPQRIFPEI